MKTVKDFRKQLRDLKPYLDELEIGNEVIKKISDGYAIRNKDDYDDPYHDYNPWVYGFKEKWIIDDYLRKGLLTNDN